MRNQTIAVILSFILVALSGLILDKPLLAQDSTNKTTNDVAFFPKWLEEHMKYLTTKKGRWITDNSNYKGEKEPFDAYCIEWVWGVGKKSLKGRLFGIINNKETPNFWEYQIFWHPKEHKAMFHQFGGDGTIGFGQLRAIKLDNKTTVDLEQIFYSPNGNSWTSLHKHYEDKNSFQTKSFTLEEGNWVEGRSYTWHNVEN